MGDFYLDDQFFDHPKALAAGEDAANLFVRGLAWAHRHNTGLIPKTAVATFTARKNVAALVAKLTAVAPGFDNPLWVDEGSHYRIHDWEIRNAKSIAKRDAGKKGARARWSKFHEEQKQNDATAYATASDPHRQNDADPMPNQPRNQRTKEPPPSPPPPLTVVGAHDPAAAFVAEVVEAVAQRQLAATKARCEVRSETGWLHAARRTLTAAHGSDIAAAHAFGESCAAVVDRLEPPPAPPKRDPNSSFTLNDGRTFLPGTGWVS
jgi:hypothetical protein